MALGKDAPGSEAWESADHIHMNTPGHIFYAKRLLEQWTKGQ